MEKKEAKSFLQWVGGKTQLLHQLIDYLPPIVKQSTFTYVEPFVGSGAMLFWILNNLSNVERAIINDRNEDLINTYRVIADYPEKLIAVLQYYHNEFFALKDSDPLRKLYYLNQRNIYNSRRSDKIVQAALFIFLNKTCFYGLYHVNSKNQFNTAINLSKMNPICNSEAIMTVSRALQKVEILNGDFDEQTFEYANEHSFYFLDPPYKPVSKTSNFNSYTQNNFDDSEQIRVKEFCDKLHAKGAKWLLCNSDVNTHHSNDYFFDKLYSGYHILRLNVKRNINQRELKQRQITDLLIKNY